MTAAATRAWLEAAPRSRASASRHRRRPRRTLRGAQPAADAAFSESLAAVCVCCCRMLQVHTMFAKALQVLSMKIVLHSRANSQPLASAEGDAQLQHAPSQPAAAAATEQRPSQQQEQAPQEGGSGRKHQPSAADHSRIRQQQQQQQRRQQQQQPRLSDEGTRQQERPRQAVQPRTLPSGAREDDKQVRGSAHHPTLCTTHKAKIDPRTTYTAQEMWLAGHRQGGHLHQA